MPRQSKFLVIEGCNGVGKSTIVDYLSARVGAATYHYPREFVTFRQEVNLDERVAPLPRLVYYMAATLHLSDLVHAQLTYGHVICDRYLASPVSLMIGESALDEAQVRELTDQFASYLCIPDLTLMLTAEHSVVRARISNRSLRSGMLTPIARKMGESREFFHRRQDACRRFAAKLGPVLELETTKLSLEEMCNSAWSLVATKLDW
jgi:thymidylate kinase